MKVVQSPPPFFSLFLLGMEFHFKSFCFLFFFLSPQQPVRQALLYTALCPSGHPYPCCWCGEPAGSPHQFGGPADARTSVLILASTTVPWLWRTVAIADYMIHIPSRRCALLSRHPGLVPSFGCCF